MQRKLLFPKEIKSLMFGFGDQINPLPESISLLDELLQEFMQDLCESAMKFNNQKLKTNDFLQALERDEKKLSRAYELLSLDKELKMARATFGDSVKMELAG